MGARSVGGGVVEGSVPGAGVRGEGAGVQMERAASKGANCSSVGSAQQNQASLRPETWQADGAGGMHVCLRFELEAV